MKGAGMAVSALLIAIAVILAIVGGGSEESPSSGSAARLVDRQELTELEADLGRPVYWAGERPPLEIEVKEEEDGSVYLRYLPEGVEPGDPRVTFLTVGTYPVVDAVDALRQVADGAGAELQESDDGAAILPNPSSEGSVYLAYPGSDIQIEVYDPAPGEALRLIRSGAIKPVGE